MAFKHDIIIIKVIFAPTLKRVCLEVQENSLLGYIKATQNFVNINFGKFPKELVMDGILDGGDKMHTT